MSRRIPFAFWLFDTMLGDRHMERREYRPNEPVDLIPVPSGLSAYLLLNPVGRVVSDNSGVCLSRQASVRGQASRQKQVVIGHRGRWARK